MRRFTPIAEARFDPSDAISCVDVDATGVVALRIGWIDVGGRSDRGLVSCPRRSSRLAAAAADQQATHQKA
jgi:hypothetical protein